MKNIKKIIVSVLIICIMASFSMVALAADYDYDNGANYVLKLEVSPATAKIGDDVTVKMYLYDEVNGDVTIAASNSLGFYFNYPADALTFKSQQAIENATVEKASDTRGKFTYLWVGEGKTFTKDTPFFTATYTANTAGTYDFVLDKSGNCTLSDVYLSAGADRYDGDGLVIDASVTVTEGSTEPTYPTIDTEETFTPGEDIGGITATDATRAISVFAKATKELPANTYGIKVVSGGKTYVFRGIAPVAKNGVWAIKVVSPDGTFNFKDSGTLSATAVDITPFED